MTCAACRMDAVVFLLHSDLLESMKEADIEMIFERAQADNLHGRPTSVQTGPRCWRISKVLCLERRRGFMGFSFSFRTPAFASVWPHCSELIHQGYEIAHTTKTESLHTSLTIVR